MNELRQRFSLADEMGARDLWGEARRRAAAPETPPRLVDWPPAMGRRLAAAAVGLAVFATAAVFAWGSFEGDIRPEPGPAVGSPHASDATGGVTKIEPFVPPSETVGNAVRMPVVFPDGSRATLVRPTSLDLATLGVQPDLSYVWQGQFPIVFLHDPNASISAYVDGKEPIATIDDSRSGIEIWGMAPRWETRQGVLQGAWLRYRLGSWTVLAATRTIADAYGVADYLQVRQTDEGFPVVDVVGPVELAEGFGEAGGAELAFGDALAAPDMVSQLDATIFLSPDGCTSDADSGPSEGYGAICLGDGHVFASIYGDRAFVTSVIEGLRVEDFRPA
jgi:hypothetical protein